jgi:hypothetical protein
MPVKAQSITHFNPEKINKNVRRRESEMVSPLQIEAKAPN